jgi:tellurite methyltransferase
MTRSPWAREYGKTPREYIWGTEPSTFARELAVLLPERARVLDLGCGEGRDSVFFARLGFQVMGVEVSRAGLRKAERLAHEFGVEIHWIRTDMARLRADGLFDLVYSCGAIHYVARDERALLVDRLKSMTRPGGYHGFVVFTDEAIYAEKGEVIDYFAPGELSRCYPDWLIHRAQRESIACSRDGVPHRHSVERFVAERPGLDKPGPAADNEDPCRAGFPVCQSSDLRGGRHPC